MAALFPFRALRPVPSAASRVASVPYDVVNTEEARALAAGNDLSFLHVSRAEIDLPAGTSPYSDEVYARAAANFEKLRREAPLEIEQQPSVYVYRLRTGDHQQTGIAACFSMDEYETGTIRKHEHTRRDKEDDRTRHMLELRAQTGPVFLTYRAVPALAASVERIAAAAPLFEVAAADGVQHVVWRADEREALDLVRAFALVPALYIADGHHRAASALRARAQLRGAGQAAGEWDTFLGVAFPHDQVRVLAYNRVVKDLGGYTAPSFLQALRSRLTVRDGSPVPERQGEVSMFIDGHWHLLQLPPSSPGQTVADSLDVSRLQDEVLGPLLGIGDVRVDPRIEFVGGGRGTAYLEQLVGSGAAAAAFSLYPVSVDDLMHVSDEGGIMPPKSTWFEPKLRDGLLSHLI